MKQYAMSNLQCGLFQYRDLQLDAIGPTTVPEEPSVEVVIGQSL